MHNFYMWLLLLVVNFGIIMAAFKLFGRLGLIMIPVMGMIIVNIQVVKGVELLGLATTIGNVLYGGTFLATDILNELYRKRDAKMSVWLGFFAIIAMTLSMTVATWFTSTDEAVGEAFEIIFGLMPRIMVASMVAYLVSQFYDIWIYRKIRKRWSGDKQVWIRNNASTATSQLIDSAMFVVIAFAGTVPTDTLWQIFITTYLLKFVVAVLDTPFIYLAKSWYRKGTYNYLNAPDFAAEGE